MQSHHKLLLILLLIFVGYFLYKHREDVSKILPLGVDKNSGETFPMASA